MPSLFQRIVAIPFWLLISIIGLPFALFARVRGDMWGGGPGVDMQNMFIRYGSLGYVLLFALVYFLGK